MKNVFLFLVLFFCVSIGYSQQYPINQTLGSPTTLVTSRGGFKADSSFILPAYSDTNKANANPYVKNYAGSLIKVGNTIYVRSTDLSQWILVGSGGGGVTQINTSAPLSGGPITTTGTIGITQAGASTDGYLSSANWNTFNSKGNGTVTSVSALTLGTTGTDLNSTIADGTTTPVITLNVPDASATARGVINTTTQTIAGDKTFSSDLTVGGATVGTRGNPNNVIFGANAAIYSGGTYNAILGSGAGQSLTSGSQNTAVGALSMFSPANGGTGQNNTAVGFYSGRYLNGSHNVGVGHQVFPWGSNLFPLTVSGTYNTALGASSGGGIGIGSNNTIIGARVSLPSELSNNVLIGDGAGNVRFRDDNTNTILPRLAGTGTRMVTAGTNGELSTQTIPSGGGVAVDTIFRTLGKDSIFYKKNNITYAIKDSVGTNPAPVGYYGAFQDTLTQTAALINTAYPVNLRVTDLSNGVTIANNSKIKIANAGIYNIQFSLQLEKTGGSGNMIADIWLRKNGVNIDGTTGKVVLTGSANASPVVAAWNYVIAVSSNDSLELMWATTNDNVVIKASPATSPHPSIPSAILTVTQQSGIMAGTGISPLDTANMLNPYLRKIDTASLSNRIDNVPTNLELLQMMGYTIKAEPYGVTLKDMTAQQAITNARTFFYPFNWNVSDSIRGVAWYNRSNTNFNQSGYNGVGVYQLSGGTLTRLTFTANDSTFWDATSNTWSSKSITPYFLSKGLYFFAYQVTGTGTLPTIMAGDPIVAGEVAGNSALNPPSVVNPNGIKYSTSVANAATTTPPSSVAMSSTTASVFIPYFLFY